MSNILNAQQKLFPEPILLLKENFYRYSSGSRVGSDFALQALTPLETPWPWILREPSLPCLRKAALTPPSRDMCRQQFGSSFQEEKKGK